jgi:sugar lactone lactonase YvrE
MFLYEQGILGGSMVDGNRYMQPGSLLTRQDAAAFIGRWLGLDPQGGVSRNPLFTDDNAISGYARSIVYQLAGMGIISGYPDGSFKPGNNISYAETSSLIHKTLTGRLLLTYFGDGNLGNATGSASDTRFALPYGLTFDNGGNLIVFDTFNAGVKQIGNGQSRTILGFTAALDDFGFIMPNYRDGASINALLGRPMDGVTAPNGDLFIVDRTNHAIRLLRGNSVFTFAGGTQGFADGSGTAAKFNNPAAIAIDNSGNLYVADTQNHVIRKITPAGVVSTVAGSPETAGRADGTDSNALFNDPSGIAVDTNGVIYVADTGNNAIRRIENGNVTTIAQNGGFSNPRGLYWTDGILFIADTGNHMIKALTRSGSIVTAAGSDTPGNADGAPGTGMMNKPTGVVYRNGTLYITDTLNNTIRTAAVDLKGRGFE